MTVAPLAAPDPNSEIIVTATAFRHTRRALRARVRRRLQGSQVQDYCPNADLIVKIRNGSILRVDILQLDLQGEDERAPAPA